MRAAVLAAYGSPDGLEVREIERPTPRAGEVVVRVHVATVAAGDSELRTSSMPWLFKVPLRLWLGPLRPRRNIVLGMELAGVIDAVGDDVADWAPGDAVFASPGMGFGAVAEYARVPVSGLIARKPDAVSFEAVAPLPIAALAALGYLRMGGVAAGKSVLVRGSSGSIGTYAVQLAKHFGARVTAVCPPQGMDRARSLGADVVIDHTQRDFTATGPYDVIVDVVGRMPISACLRALAPDGAYVRCTVPGVWEVLQALWIWIASRKRVVLGDAGGTSEDLAFLAGLVEAGTLETVIDRRFALDEIRDAHRYVDGGHKQGHVVIDVARG